MRICEAKFDWSKTWFRSCRHVWLARNMAKVQHGLSNMMANLSLNEGKTTNLPVKHGLTHMMFNLSICINECKITVKNFTNFYGLEEFTKRHEFEVALIYADGKKGKKSSAWLKWLGDLIGPNSYNDYRWTEKKKYEEKNMEGVSEYEFTCEYYGNQCCQLGRIPSPTKNMLKLEPDGMKISQGEFLGFNENMPLCCHIYDGCYDVFYDHVQNSLILKDYGSHQGIKISAIEVTLKGERSKSYCKEMQNSLTTKGFEFPSPYTCMEESITHYLSGLVWYSKKSPVAQIYYYWLQDYLTTRLILHVMRETEEASKLKKKEPLWPYNYDNYDNYNLDWGKLRASAAVLFIGELNRILPQLPTFRWKVADDYR